MSRKPSVKIQDRTTEPRRWDTKNHEKVHWYYECCNTVLTLWDADSITWCELHDKAPRQVRAPVKRSTTSHLS